MKNADTEYVIIGKFASTFGIHGWIKVKAYTEFGANILDYHPWYVQREQNTWTPIEVESSRIQGDAVMVKIANIDSPEQARLLTNSTIAIIRSQLPELEENEYYWSDLIGLTVIDQHGKTLGKVAFIMETGSNDVLVVKGEKEHAIPYLMGKVITSIDLDKQEIHVDWELL